jgi:outer membrane protein OmpA-like peptidoglycan-associated protein
LSFIEREKEDVVFRLFKIFVPQLLITSYLGFYSQLTQAETAPASSGITIAGSDQSKQATLDYIGDKARIGVGIDDDFHLVGELLYATDPQDDSTWIGEAWVNRGAGGLKLNYHWLSNDNLTNDNAVSADQNPDLDPVVFKLFAAIDQNRDEDRKATLGGGLEKNRWFLSGHFSAAITGKRGDGKSIEETERTLEGFEGERAYTQLETTSTTTRFFIHPYDYGVGLRFGHFYDQSLLRVRMGLDYEIGDYDSSQATLSLGLEKFFVGSGHSLALTVEHFKKEGDFEHQRTDTRGVLLLRYSFGENYQPSHVLRQVQKEQVVAAIPAVKEKKLIKDQVDLRLETLFGLDQSKLTEKSEELLKSIARRLKLGEIIGKISVVGHTCDLGPADYNQKLSEQRAKSVKDKLVALGFDPDQIITEGRGESQPKVANDSEANRRLNRRVKIQFLQMVEEEVEVKAAAPATTEVVWVAERVANAPAWIRRSLLNPAQHKRVVDVYKYEKKSVETTLGERQFANNAPRANDDVIVLQRNSNASVIDVLANDDDIDGDDLSIVAVTQPENGVVDNFGDLLTYQANSGYAGTDSFSYTVRDANGEESVASVFVTISNSLPVTNTDTATTAANQAVIIDVLANDSDQDNDNLTIASVTQPANGTVSIEDGNVRYVPNGSFVGEDSFSYVSTDGLATTIGQVIITVTGAAPQAVTDSATTSFETPVTISVLDNDVPALGGQLSIISTTQPSNGTVAIEANQIRYTPAAGFSGSDSFSYTIQEDSGLTQIATVTVEVSDAPPANQAPVASDDSFLLTSLTDIVTLDVLANDSDPDGDTLTITGLDNLPPTTRAVITINPDNTLTFAPQPAWQGLVLEFTYTVDDGKGGQATATVRVKC